MDMFAKMTETCFDHSGGVMRTHKTSTVIQDKNPIRVKLYNTGTHCISNYDPRLGTSNPDIHEPSSYMNDVFIVRNLSDWLCCR